MAPRSGPAASGGDSVRAAVALAITHAKEDARLPPNIEIKIVSLDESTQSGAAGAANRRLRNGAVVAVIGSLLPSSFPDLRRVSAARSVAFAAVGAVLSQDVPVDVASAQPGPSAAPAAPAFRMIADESVAAAWLGKQLLPETVPVAFVHDGTSAGRSSLSAFAVGLATTTTGSSTPSGPIVLNNGAIDPALVLRLSQQPAGRVVVGGSMEAASRLSAALRALDPTLVVQTNTMDALIRDSAAQPRFRTWLIGLFSIFALARP